MTLRPVLPGEWAVMTLAELGGQVTSGSRAWAAKYADRGSLFVRITNLTRASVRLDLTNSKRVDVDPEDPEARRTLLKPHDLLLSITADIGIVGLVEDDTPTPAYINQHIARVRLDPKRADSRFVAYYLASWVPQRAFVGATDQGAKAGMNLATVSSILTVVPPRDEQTRIATVLQAADELVAKLEQQIEKKRAIKQGMMQQLLTGKTRLPGFVGEWRVRPYADVVTIRKGMVLPAPQSKGHIPVIAAGRGPAGFTERANRAGPVVTISASGASAGFVAMHRGQIWASDCSTIEVSRRYDLNFIYYSLVLRQDEIYLTQTGGAQPHVHAKDVYALDLQIPVEIAEQTAISGVLDDAADEIDALGRRLTSVRAIRHGLMQELLTGRTRLPRVEVTV